MELLNLETALGLDQAYLFQKALDIFNKSWRSWEYEEKILATAIMHKFSFFLRISNEAHLNDLIQACMKKAKLEFYKKGQQIFHIGDDTKKLYFILQGNAIKFKLKTEEEIALKYANLEERHGMPKLLNVLELLGIGHTDFEHRIAQRKLTESKGQNKFSTKRTLISKLKEIRELIPNGINFDIISYAGSLKIIEKYFKNGVCTIQYEKTIFPGDILGENDVLMDKPHSSFLVCSTDLYLFSITKKDFNHLFDQLKTTNEKKHIFSTVFPQFREEVLRKFCLCLEEKTFRINECIYEQNDDANGIYFVKSGEVQLLKFVDEGENITSFQHDLQIDHRRNKSISLALVSQNQFFGEEIFLTKKKREQRAVAKSNVILFRLSSKIIKRYPLDLFQILEWIKKNALMKIEWREKRLKRFLSKDEASPEDEPQNINNCLLSQRETTKKIIQTIQSDRARFASKKKPLSVNKMFESKNNESVKIKIFGAPNTKALVKEINKNSYGLDFNYEIKHKNSAPCGEIIIPSFITHHIPSPTPILEINNGPNQYLFPCIDDLNKTPPSKLKYLKCATEKHELKPYSTILNSSSIDSMLQSTFKGRNDLNCKLALHENNETCAQTIPKINIPNTGVNNNSGGGGGNGSGDLNSELLSDKPLIKSDRTEYINPTTTRNFSLSSTNNNNNNNRVKPITKPRVPPISIISFKKGNPSISTTNIVEPKSQRNFSTKYLEFNSRIDSDDLVEYSTYFSLTNQPKSAESPKGLLTKTQNFPSFFENKLSSRIPSNSSNTMSKSNDIRQMNYYTQFNFFGSGKMRQSKCVSANRF